MRRHEPAELVDGHGPFLVLIEVCSAMVNGFVAVRAEHPNIAWGVLPAMLNLNNVVDLENFVKAQHIDRAPAKLTASH